MKNNAESHNELARPERAISGMNVLPAIATYFLSNRSPARPPIYAKNEPAPNAMPVMMPYQYTGSWSEKTI
jgi:hypothetical protein